MKSKVENVKVVSKCDITINLENDREILALKNICSMAENKCFEHMRDPDNCKEELQIIKILRDATNGC